MSSWVERGWTQVRVRLMNDIVGSISRRNWPAVASHHPTGEGNGSAAARMRSCGRRDYSKARHGILQNVRQVRRLRHQARFKITGRRLGRRRGGLNPGTARRLVHIGLETLMYQGQYVWYAKNR
jgi:hypothetical protein